MKKGIKEMRSYLDNWDGVKRKSLSFGEAVTTAKSTAKGPRDYDRVVRNFLDHVRNRSAELYNSIRGRKVYVISTVYSYEANVSSKQKATYSDEAFYGFCPLDNGKVVSFTTNYNVRYTSALWGTVTSAVLEKDAARDNYVKIKKDPKFEFEMEVTA